MVTAAQAYWLNRKRRRARNEGVGDPIARYFATGVNGFDIDFSRTDRLFQNANSTPVDGAGENVSLALDGHGWAGLSYAQKMSAQPELFAGFPSGIGTWVANGGGSWSIDGTQINDQDLNGDGTISATTGNILNWRYTISGANAALDIFENNTAPHATNGAFNATWDRLRQRNSGLVRFRAQAGEIATVSGISVKLVPGDHGLQTLANSQPKWQTGGIARADGSDDGLLTTKKMGAAGFVMGKHLTTAAPASTKVLCGASGASTDYGYCGVDTAGKGVARIGTGTAMTSDDVVTGAIGTLGFWWNGSIAALLVNGVEVKTQAQSGAPTTAQALALFCLNNNGSPGSWLGTDGYRFIHGDSAPDDATLLAFHNKLMAA